MVSEPEKSIAEGVITPWRRGPKRMQAYYKKLQGALVKHFRVDEEAPFAELPENLRARFILEQARRRLKLSSAVTVRRSPSRLRVWCHKCSGSTRKPKANLPVIGFVPS